MLTTLNRFVNVIPEMMDIFDKAIWLHHYYLYYYYYAEV